MGTNQPWNWRLTVLKTIKMTLVRPPTTNNKTTVTADCAVSACSPLPPSLKPLAHWLSVGGESAFGQESPTLTLPKLPASKIKQTFLSSNLASLLVFERRAAGPPLSASRGRPHPLTLRRRQSFGESPVPWRGLEADTPQFESQRLHVQTYPSRWSR